MYKYLTQKELAERWRISPGTLINWRRKGILPYFQVPDSSRVLYNIRDIERIEQSHRKEATIRKPVSNRNWRI
ncbi:MAG: terminase [Desulfobulbus propionicus]|nr:MAG: terminase [Desulfobulbus propionicus]